MDFATDDKTVNLQIAREYKSLLKISYQTLSEYDKALIRKALDVAIEAHSSQTRKSGKPYIFHPISVAKILQKCILWIVLLNKIFLKIIYFVFFKKNRHNM